MVTIMTWIAGAIVIAVYSLIGLTIFAVRFMDTGMNHPTVTWFDIIFAAVICAFWPIGIPLLVAGFIIRGLFR